MKNSSFLLRLSAAFALAAYLPMSKESAQAIDHFRRNRKRKKKGSGKGGAGVTLRKFAPTRQPPGYYIQVTPIKHLHGAQRPGALLRKLNTI